MQIQTIAHMIVAARKRKGLTQRQLAAASGIRRKWLGRWERGRALPNEAQWRKLAQLVELPRIAEHAALPGPASKGGSLRLV